MLDVLPPHHRLEGLKDFFIHLLTISVGLLIAVGIEGCVERHQHRELARDAKEMLRKEIEGNAKKMADTLAEIDKDEASVKENMDTVRRFAQHPNDKNQHGTISFNFSFPEWDNTAWTTAQTTGALAYMPYNEANQFSRIYDAQHSVTIAQEKLAEDEAQFVGALYGSGIDKGGLTPEEAALLLDRIGVIQSHLITLKIMVGESAVVDKKFLTGKDATYTFHEDFK